MNIAISRANESHLYDCVAALADSELGRIYFASEEKALASIAEGLAREEVFVALDDAGECLGFIWFVLGGAFHSFPYLHVIAVKAAHRGKGVGRELLRFFEDGVFENSSKAFLVVADFNPDARRLYERLGWRQVGAIPGLYREGVTEYLMMKSKSEPIYHIASSVCPTAIGCAPRPPTTPKLPKPGWRTTWRRSGRGRARQREGKEKHEEAVVLG